MQVQEDYYPSEIHKVSRVLPVGGYRLQVWFTNGAVGEWDYADVVALSGPMVQPLRSPEFFAQVSICRGALEWPNGFDQCPDALYFNMYRGGAFAPGAPLP